jgi:hypothetical protein
LNASQRVSDLEEEKEKKKFGEKKLTSIKEKKEFRPRQIRRASERLKKDNEVRIEEGNRRMVVKSESRLEGVNRRNLKFINLNTKLQPMLALE